MALPSRAEAETLLASFDLPDGVVLHARGVSRVAATAARLLASAGVEVDAHLVEVAALLHDIDKVETRRSGEQHGIVGARWLTERGYPELAEAVAAHPITCLLDLARFPASWAARLVSIADRRVDQRFVSIDARIDGMAARYPEYTDELQAARAPAHALEAELVAALASSPATLEGALRAAWEEAEVPAR